LSMIASSCYMTSGARQDDVFSSHNLRRAQETCIAQGESPYLGEAFVSFSYDGDFPVDDGIEEAFVMVYNDLVNCTQADASREIVAVEFLGVNEETQEFMMRLGTFCNSCAPLGEDFEDCGVTVFADINGTDVGSEFCDCPGPDLVDLTISLNMFLEEFTNATITLFDGKQMCAGEEGGEGGADKADVEEEEDKEDTEEEEDKEDAEEEEDKEDKDERQ